MLWRRACGPAGVSSWSTLALRSAVEVRVTAAAMSWRPGRALRGRWLCTVHCWRIPLRWFWWSWKRSPPHSSPSSPSRCATSGSARALSAGGRVAGLGGPEGWGVGGGEKRRWRRREGSWLRPLSPHLLSPHPHTSGRNWGIICLWGARGQSVQRRTVCWTSDGIDGLLGEDSCHVMDVQMTNVWRESVEWKIFWYHGEYKITLGSDHIGRASHTRMHVCSHTRTPGHTHYGTLLPCCTYTPNLCESFNKDFTLHSILFIWRLCFYFKNPPTKMFLYLLRIVERMVSQINANHPLSYKCNIYECS